MILEGSLAFNLDPSSLANEEVLRDSLVKVGLWQHVSADSGDSEIDPLDKKLSALPALSVGQLQLLAMARAIVQKEGSRPGGFFVDREGMHGAKPIVLLDEATSSLDPATEAAIYDLIESEFVEAGHTVIIIAHRMSAFSGRVRPGKDVVVFLDSGHVAQVGSYDDLAEYVSTVEEVSRR